MPHRPPPDLGVVVVGAGDMGARHADAWLHAGARLRAVVDADPERAAALATRTGADSGPDLEPFLGGDTHVVSVCTPTFLHARYTVAALAGGSHVLCEKPAALSIRDALAMRDAAVRHRRELRIGFMRRFDPAFAALTSFAGRIGGPVLAQASITAGIRPKRLMHDALANGGPIVDMCCHLFVLWREILGAQPELVTARGYTFSEGRPELSGIVERALDSALVTLEYEGGSVAQIQVSWGLPAGIEPVERHTYVGPDGLVSVDWPRRLTLRDAGGVTRWSSSGVDPWREEIVQFHRELTAGAPLRVATIDDGIDALLASLAVLRSVRERRSVRLEEVRRELAEAEGRVDGDERVDAGAAVAP